MVYIEANNAVFKYLRKLKKPQVVIICIFELVCVVGKEYGISYDYLSGVHTSAHFVLSKKKVLQYMHIELKIEFSSA